MFVKNRGHWSSGFAFILAATGAAVGLGNIWRFPYMAGMHGGSAFVLVYLACVLLIGVPVMMAEILIGRRAQLNSVDAMKVQALDNGKTSRWSFVGWWGALALLLTLSFYSVVSGWSLAYVFKMLGGDMVGATASQINQTWTTFLHNPLKLTFWHTLFIIITMWVVSRGVRNGLELACKIMMPLLYVILVILVIYAGIKGDFHQAVTFLFSPDFSKIDGYVIVAAMGHAFFTLALGAGAMLVYGSYLNKDVSIAKSTFIIAGLDVVVALLAGLAIFPIIFAHGVAPDSGPGLMFISLPVSFAQFPEGNVVGAFFFLLLFFASWTSSINLAEPMVDILIEKCALTRNFASVVVGCLAWFIGLGSVLSFSLWENVKLFDRWTLFDVATDVPTEIILPIGGFCFAVFAGWAMTRKNTQDELGIKNPALYCVWRFLVRYISPAGILIIFGASFVNVL